MLTKLRVSLAAGVTLASMTTGFALAMLGSAAQAQAVTGRSSALPMAPALTSETAPDAVGKQVLSRTLRKFDEGSPVAADPSPVIHRNFPQMIEQNFARLNRVQAAVMIDALTERELSDLAQLYVNSTAEHRLPARLLPVLANRLPASQLLRLTRHFGDAAVAEAVSGAADLQTKVAFARAPKVGFQGPRAGEMGFGKDSRVPPDVRIRKTLAADFYGDRDVEMRKVLMNFTTIWSYTPAEIYLAFRTAPNGAALGVQGALLETTIVLTRYLAPSYGFGYAIGTVIAPLIETYAPQTYDAIGGTISGIIDRLIGTQDGPQSVAGPGQAQAAVEMGVPEGAQQIFATTGGDYEAAQPWADWVASETSGCSANPRVRERECVYN